MARKITKTKKRTSEVTKELSSTEEHKSQTGSSEASVDHLYDAYKDFTETSSDVIKKAASILEEEVAAGIIAAKKVEEHFVDAGELRSGRPEEVMQRFRRDAHEVIDIAIDIVSVAMKSMYSISQNVIKIRSGDDQAVITTPQPIKAGDSSEIPISLENSGDTPTDEFNLYSTELVSASGERISASQISFTPPSLTIDPHKTEKVIVIINVPEGTQAGVYSGLVLATNLNQLRSVMIVQVE